MRDIELIKDFIVKYNNIKFIIDKNPKNYLDLNNGLFYFYNYRYIDVSKRWKYRTHYQRNIITKWLYLKVLMEKEPLADLCLLYHYYHETGINMCTKNIKITTRFAKKILKHSKNYIECTKYALNVLEYIKTAKEYYTDSAGV